MNYTNCMFSNKSRVRYKLVCTIVIRDCADCLAVLIFHLNLCNGVVNLIEVELGKGFEDSLVDRRGRTRALDGLELLILALVLLWRELLLVVRLALRYHLLL